MQDEINEVSHNNSDNPIFDIVSSIQNKLNETNNETNMSSNDNSKKKDLSELDISKMLEMLNSSKITKNSNNMNTTPSTPVNSGLNIDLGTIMNFQKILGGLNTPDPRNNLLSSLKPFLRETRQKNIDTYISLLGIMKTFNIFSNKDRD